MIAYYWSQFDIPVKDLEIVPEFSEERVLEALENGIKEQQRVLSPVKIREITASCRYHLGQVGGWVTPRGISTTMTLLQLAPDYDI